MELLKKVKKTGDNPDEVFIYTEDQLMARLRFFIGICLALTLTGIVFVVLYSIIFVTQPLNAISPIDQKFFELIIPIATFLTGTLSGIMLAGNDKDAKMKALEAATKAPTVSGSSSSNTTGSFGGGASFGSSSGFSANANIGGLNMSYRSPSANPGFTGATTFPNPAAASSFGMTPSGPKMSSTGKPMPFQPEDEEL